MEVTRYYEGALATCSMTSSQQDTTSPKYFHGSKGRVGRAEIDSTSEMVDNNGENICRQYLVI